MLGWSRGTLAPILLLAAIVPAGATAGQGFVDLGVPAHTVSGTITTPGGCTTIDLSTDVEPPLPSADALDGEPFILHTDPPDPRPNSYADMFVVFHHPSEQRSILQPAIGSDLKRVDAHDTTVIDKLTGGDTDVIVAPIREIGTIPDGTTAIDICLRETVKSYLHYYQGQNLLDWAEPAKFTLNLGGTLPSGMTLVEVDVLAYPLAGSGPTHGMSLPIEAGTVTMPTMPGYGIATAEFIEYTPQGQAVVSMCEDLDDNGQCSAGEPSSEGCVGTHYMDRGAISIPISGDGHNVLVTIATEPVGSDCGPEAELATAAPEHGGSTHPLEYQGGVMGEVWLSFCESGPCRPKAPIDVF